MAGRTRLTAYLGYSWILTGFVYPCVVHWTWSKDAWLADGHGPSGSLEGYKDFAGSGVVHVTGGTAALIGAIMVGPRSAAKGMSYTVSKESSGCTKG